MGHVTETRTDVVVFLGPGLLVAPTHVTWAGSGLHALCFHMHRHVSPLRSEEEHVTDNAAWRKCTAQPLDVAMVPSTETIFFPVFEGLLI